MEGRGRGSRGGERRSKAEQKHMAGEFTIIRGLIDGEDGSIVVDLPNLGAYHVLILSCVFIAGAYFGR